MLSFLLGAVPDRNSRTLVTNRTRFNRRYASQCLARARGGHLPPEAAYYGSDASLYAKRAAGQPCRRQQATLLLVTAEYDPVDIAPDAYDLAAKVCVRDGKCPAFFYVKGHNHISEIGSIGSPDDQLARTLVDFVRSTK